MKLISNILICSGMLTSALLAEPVQETAEEKIKRHGEGSLKLADEQDELSADVQDLIDEQTNTKLIELLREVETIMADATDHLSNKETGGVTIATQTEVIEKIFQAAKQKQQQRQQEQQQQQQDGDGQEDGEGQGPPKPGQGQPGQGQPGQPGDSMGGMMKMLENMMNGGQDLTQEPNQEEGEKPGEPGDKPGQGGGSGKGEGSGTSGDPDNTQEGGQRRVPKSSGSAGSTLPREFHKAMDAYNKGAAKQSQR